MEIQQLSDDIKTINEKIDDLELLLAKLIFSLEKSQERKLIKRCIYRFRCGKQCKGLASKGDYCFDHREL